MVRAKALHQSRFYFEAVSKLLKLILFALFVALITSGCTKKEEVSSATFEIPSAQELRQAAFKGDVSAQGIETRIARIMLNISGEGIANPPVIIWDSNGGSATPPPNFTIDIPRGPARLFQALVVLEEKDTSAENVSGGKMLFFYGDATKDLSADVESVALTLAPAGSATSGDGRISGRWLNTDGSGPTGTVTMRFHPNNGRPPMIVSRTGIYGGWFEFFALQDIPFSYVMDNGLVLFNQITTSSSALVTSGDSRSIKAYRPLGYYNRWDGVSTTSRGQAPPSRMIAGFFGPGSAGKKICYDTTPSIFDYLYVTSDVTDATKMPWTGSTPTSVGAGVELGGSGATAAACNGTTDVFLKDYLKFDHRKLAYGDSLFENRGPYLAFDPNNQGWKTHLHGVHDGTKLNLGWRYMPGVYSGVAGSAVFYRVRPPKPEPSPTPGTTDNYERPDYEVDDGIDCNNLTDPNRYSPAFIMASRVVAVQPTAAQPIPPQTYSLANVINQADFDAGNVDVIICPFGPMTDKFYTGGVDLKRGSTSGGSVGGGTGGGGSGGGGSAPAVTRSMRFTVPSNIGMGTCQSGTVEYLEAGVVTTTTANESVGLQYWPTIPGSTPVTFYPTANNCDLGTQQISLMTIPQGQSSATFWMKVTSNGMFDIGGTFSTNYVQSARTAVYVLQTPTKVAVRGYEHRLAGGYCYPLEVMLKGSMGELANNAARTVTLIDSSYAAAGGAYFSDETCSTALTSNSLAFTATEAFKKIFFKPNQASTAGLYSVTGSGLSMVEPYDYDLAPPILTRMAIRRADVGQDLASSVLYNPNECIPVNAEPVASNGARLKLTGDTTMTIQNGTVSSSLMFSSDYNCSISASSKTVSLFTGSSGTHSEQFFIKVPATTAPSADLQMTLAAPVLTSYQTILREPAAVQLMPDTTNGAFMAGFCHKVTLKLTDSSNQPFLMPTNTSIGVSPFVDFGSFSVYSDPNCAAPDNTWWNGIKFVMGQTTVKEFFIRASSPFQFVYKIHGSPINRAGGLGISSISNSNATAIANLPTNMGANACVPIQANFYDSNTNTLISTTAAVTVNYGISGIMSNVIGFYDEPSCSTPLPGNTAFFPPGTSYMTKYMKLSSTFTSGTTNINIGFPQFNSNHTVGATITCTASTCN